MLQSLHQQSQNQQNTILQHIQNESELKERFHVDTSIGTGSYGNVYKVTKRQTYAMKVYKQDISEICERDLVELNIMTQIKSKYICQVIDSFISSSKQLCAVSELARFGNLKEYCDREFKEKIPEELVKQWIAQTALGLKELHSRNIIHRDIKPQNILVFEKDNVMIADYGLAKTVSLDKPQTKTVGTWQYMSIEMLEEQPYDYSTDIFSLGVTFIHLLSQRFPILTSEKEWQVPKMNSYSNELVKMILSMINIKKELRPNVDDIIYDPLIADTKAIQEFRKYFSIDKETFGKKQDTGKFNSNVNKYSNRQAIQNSIKESQKYKQVGIQNIKIKEQKVKQTWMQQSTQIQEKISQLSQKLKEIYSTFQQFKSKQSHQNQVKRPSKSNITSRGNSKELKQPTRPISQLPKKRRGKSKEIRPSAQETLFMIDNQHDDDITDISYIDQKNYVEEETKCDLNSIINKIQSPKHDNRLQSATIQYEEPLQQTYYYNRELQSITRSNENSSQYQNILYNVKDLVFHAVYLQKQIQEYNPKTNQNGETLQETPETQRESNDNSNLHGAYVNQNGEAQNYQTVQFELDEPTDNNIWNNQYQRQFDIQEEHKLQQPQIHQRDISYQVNSQIQREQQHVSMLHAQNQYDNIKYQNQNNLQIQRPQTSQQQRRNNSEIQSTIQQYMLNQTIDSTQNYVQQNDIQRSQNIHVRHSSVNPKNSIINEHQLGIQNNDEKNHRKDKNLRKNFYQNKQQVSDFDTKYQNQEKIVIKMRDVQNSNNSSFLESLEKSIMYQTIQPKQHQPYVQLQQNKYNLDYPTIFDCIVNSEVSFHLDSILKDHIPHYKNLNFKSVFKASTVNFSKQALNECFESQIRGQTLIFILSEHGQVFGGYLSKPWPKTVGKYMDDYAFIFNLSKSTIHPQQTKVFQKNIGGDLQQSSNYAFELNQGELFAFGEDIRISNNCNTEMTSSCNLGHTYALPNDMKYESIQSQNYMAGEQKFKVIEIQIFTSVSQFD
eukprot:403377024